MILNREAGQTQNVRLILDGEVDVVLRLPPRSCTSLIVKGDEVRVSGIGGGCGLGPRPHRRTANAQTASLSALIGRILTTLRAGLAL
jgi:hypothetical protein